MNFDEFCQELSNATATGKYAWLLTDAASQLRAVHPEHTICCPITAVHHYCTGRFIGVSQAKNIAAFELGLDRDLAGWIMLAADNYCDEAEARKIRRHLIKVVRLGDS